MTEEENQGVEALQGAEAVAQAAETEDVQEARQEPAEERRKRNDAEYNWAEARRKMQELDRQNREMADQLARMQKPKQDEDDLDKLGDEDIVTKAHAKRLAEKMARQIAQDVLHQRDMETLDERLINKFPDFNEIVTPENLELLKQKKPELAKSLYQNSDKWNQAVSAYETLKLMGIGGEVAKNPEKERAIKNSQKPVSVNAVAKTSAIGNVHHFENGLTPELKKQLWKEMQDARKSY
jgi:hypothetical protein